MERVDSRKSHKDLYNPPTKKITIVDVPEMNFLMIDGSGDPNTSQEYRDAVEALFSLSYSLKFMIKKAKKIDYVVMPLEGLWWTEDMSKFAESKGSWKWTSMIMQPEIVTKDFVLKARDDLKKKKLPALPKVRFEKYHEGKSAQIMYIGPFSDEGPTIQQIHEYIAQNNRILAGRHHEIYLSDFRRVSPNKMKTILRQPIIVK